MTERLPLVSVIMPVRNEAIFIRRSLGAVLAQDYPPDRMEVLVVDGMSNDGTASIVRELAAGDNRVRLMANPGIIQARALNRALEVAQGDLILRVDGHTVIAPDYVNRCVHHLATTGADNVGGPQRCIGLTPMGRAIAAAYRSPFGVPSQFTMGRRSGYVDTVYMGAWPRRVFEQVGQFDESLAANEDYEFNYRIRKAGGKVYLALDIRSEYYVQNTLTALWRQFFHYGRWKFRMLTKHPASVRLRHPVAPAFVGVLIGGGLLAFVHRRARRLLGWVVVWNGLANGLASLHAGQRETGITARLPVVFACMHLAWGTGFWREAALALLEHSQ